MYNLEIPEQVNPVPDKWAVLIGIEYYEHPEQPTTTPRYDGRGNKIEYKSLRGCVNDVLAVEQYLVDTIKVNPKHISKLLAPYPGRRYPSQLPAGSYRDPTYNNIVDALKVPESAKKGDFVYIHFSGHGARATTVFPELKRGGADAEDQALVPSDITRGGSYLRDLEMGVLLQEMVDAGLVVTVVLDCCHSGGAVRGDDNPELGEIRGISDIYKSDPELDQPKAIDRVMHWGDQQIWMDAPKGFVVLAACEEHQTAAEVSVKENNHGLLTYWLMTILRNSPLELSSQALYEQVYIKVQDRNRNQTPYLVGDKDRFFFSKKLRSRVYAVKVRKAAVDTRKDLEDRWVHLAGGILHGVVEGSEYAILPLGFDLSKQVEAADVLARVQVTKVMTGQSITSFTRADEVRWEEIKEGCPAVLRKLPIMKKFTVHFITHDDRMREDFKKDWHQKNGNQTWLSLGGEDDSNPFFTISIDDNGDFKISDQPGNFTAAIRNAAQPLPAEAVDSMAALICRLEHLARFKMTMELTNPVVRPYTSSALISIKVDNAPEGMEHEGQWICPANIEKRDGTYVVDEMTLFRITIKNESDRPLGCVVLNCGAEFGIEQLFPLGEQYKRLTQGETIARDFGMQVAPELRAAAGNGIAIVDRLKIFVCDPPRNLDLLQLPGLKEMEEGITRGVAKNGSWSLGLEDLLADLNMSRLGFSVSSRQEIDWETADVRIRIKLQS